MAQGSQNGMSNNPAGTTSKYDDDMPNRLIKFFCEAEAYDVHEDPVTNKKSFTFRRLPTFERWCINENITVMTMGNYVREHPAFAEAHAKAKAAQRDLLEQGAMSGSYKEGIVKLILSHNHGMSERSITEHAGSIDTANMSEDQLNARVSALLAASKKPDESSED
jgi:hypothetical protein